MGLSYKGLWKKLIDADLKKTDLLKLAHISSATLAQMGKNYAVSMGAIEKICLALDCDIGDVVEFVDDKSKDNEEIK